MDEIRYAMLHLSSGDFQYGDKNKPTFIFEHEIDNFDSLRVTRAIIPATYYVFGAGYTSCTIQGTVVSWPQGNYTPAEWIGLVQPQVAGLTITYSDTTGKFTFTSASNITLSFSATELAWELIGANSGSSTPGTTSYTLPNTAQMSGPNYLYLHASNANFFNRSSMVYSNCAKRTQTQPNDILAMIPITVNRWGLIEYKEDDSVDAQFRWDTISDKQLTFYLTLGDRTTVLDLNGSTYQLWINGTQSMYSSTNQRNRYTRTG